jgi:hypothetical protein
LRNVSCFFRSHHISPGLWVLTQAKKELTKLTGKALGSAAGKLEDSPDDHGMRGQADSHVLKWERGHVDRLNPL